MKKSTNKKILLADDEVHILEMLCEMLELSGFECITAINGEEALQIYEKHKEDIAMVVLDILMPKVSGIEVYKKIHSESPEIKILFISGFTEKDEIKIFLDETEAPFLNKPFHFEEFLKKVSAILKQ